MIEVIRQPNSLEREVWHFEIIATRNYVKIVLGNYSKEHKPTIRHKWQTISNYDRFRQRSGLKASETPLPDDVETEAIEQFMTMVKVVKEL